MSRIDVWALHQRIALRSYNPAVYEEVCRTLCEHGEEGYAAGIFARWLAVDPCNARARHLRASLLGVGVPDRCTEGYLRSEFDSFSDSFDAVLAGLSYQAPHLVADALTRAQPSAKSALDILDAGCGTGLCGPLLRPWARRLVGVDVSGGMLTRAEQRAEYDDLVQSDLVAFARTQPATFDLIVSSDVLVYFGRLQDVFDAMACALRSGGQLIATVEWHEGDSDFQLNATGRFSHGGPYVASSLARAGLTAAALTTVVLRQENGNPVPGLLIEARKEAYQRPGAVIPACS